MAHFFRGVVNFGNYSANNTGFQVSNVSIGGKITMNGKTYTGRNMTMSNGKMFVDGVEVDINSGKTVKPEDIIHVTIVITGNVDELKGNFNEATVNGNVGSLSSNGGNVTVNETVNGHVESSGGDVTVKGSVGGNVNSTGGDVKIHGKVSGNVSTMGGSISYKK